MPKAKKLPPEQGRKSHYVARNRAKIIKATQQLLGEQGQATTIEEVAERSEMAASSIYKHFATKEDLFNTAIASGFSEWQSWASEFASKYESDIEKLVIPMRLIVRVKQSHPIYAKLIGQNPDAVNALRFEVNQQLKAHLSKMQKSNSIDLPDLDLRFLNLVAVLSSTLLKTISDDKFTTKQAEKSIMIALQMVGLPEEVTLPIFSLPLDFGNLT